MGEERARQLGGLDVAGGLQVRDAVVRVHLRAAQVLGGDALARDRLDHLRAGQEQPRVLPGHDGQVAERRRVRGTAGARAADDADLRHGRDRLRAEDRRVGLQRSRALLQARAAGVGEADDGRPDARRGLDRARDRGAAGGAQRAAHEGAVLGPGVHGAAADAPAAGDDAVADGAAHRPEGPSVEQQLEAHPRQRQRGAVDDDWLSGYCRDRYQCAT